MGVPWRVVSRPRLVSASIARTTLDRPILHLLASSRLLALMAAAPRACRRSSSMRTRSSASLRVGAMAARASIGAADNEYYVNLLPDPGPPNKKMARPPAEWGPGPREETDCFPRTKPITPGDP